MESFEYDLMFLWIFASLRPTLSIFHIWKIDNTVDNFDLTVFLLDNRQGKF